MAKFKIHATKYSLQIHFTLSLAFLGTMGSHESQCNPTDLTEMKKRPGKRDEWLLYCITTAKAFRYKVSQILKESIFSFRLRKLRSNTNCANKVLQQIYS